MCFVKLSGISAVICYTKVGECVMDTLLFPVLVTSPGQVETVKKYML